MKSMSLADVRKHTGCRMSLEEAQKIVGNRPTTRIANRAVALSLHTWNNAVEDWRRLEAALIVRKRRSRQERH
jgi:hypothetical protein